MSTFTIVIHGGAGTIVKEDMTPELERVHYDGIRDALDAGYRILEKGGSAVDAVKASCVSLENNLLFNAGRGAVFTKSGGHEMDAAVMDGHLMKAGAVASVKDVKNPVLLAGAVMDKSEYVLLSGEGARNFALRQGLELAGEDYFFSQFRYDQWKEVRDSDFVSLDHGKGPVERLMKNKKFGTIGAVALDSKGHLAAATSTGGMTNKNYSRIGDTPLIGSGTYANDATCAVSCTGHGEVFILAVAAYDVSCLVEYKGLSLQEAVDKVVHDKLVHMKGEGGLIAVDPQGNPVLAFNSQGMYRGYRRSDGSELMAIFE